MVGGMGVECHPFDLSLDFSKHSGFFHDFCSQDVFATIRSGLDCHVKSQQKKKHIALPKHGIYSHY